MAVAQLLGGGIHAEPIAFDELKLFVPDAFRGLQKTRSSAAKDGFAGVMVSEADHFCHAVGSRRVH